MFISNSGTCGEAYLKLLFIVSVVPFFPMCEIMIINPFLKNYPVRGTLYDTDDLRSVLRALKRPIVD